MPTLVLSFLVLISKPTCETRSLVVVESTADGQGEWSRLVSYSVCTGGAQPKSQRAVRVCDKEDGSSVWAAQRNVGVVTDFLCR